MGCGISYTIDSFYCYSYYSSEVEKIYTHSKYYKWRKTFESLRMKRNEVTLIHRIFHTADLDKSGEIDIAELLTVMDVERTPFSERVFSLFDENHSGRIDFLEFILSLWNYCTLSIYTLGMFLPISPLMHSYSLTMANLSTVSSGLGVFAFDLFDTDKSGVLDGQEIDRMFVELFGANYMESNISARKIRQDLQDYMKYDQDITLSHFIEFSFHHEYLLFPAFTLQTILKEKILGKEFWRICADRRIQLSNRKYLTVRQILEMVSQPMPPFNLSYHFPLLSLPVFPSYLSISHPASFFFI
jgi:Ca2+-binding EF-hand superfamily protein